MDGHRLDCLDQSNAAETLKAVLASSCVDRTVCAHVYSSKTDSVRVVKISPSWSSNHDDKNQPNQNYGFLGLSIRYASFANARQHVWHVLEVEPNSPANLAGLRSFSDYIIGADALIEDSEDLFSLIEEQRPLSLYVYNYVTDETRVVNVTPNASWSSSSGSLLGCSLGYGLLHRIPSRPLTEETTEAVAPTLVGQDNNKSHHDDHQVPMQPQVSSPTIGQQQPPPNVVTTNVVTTSSEKVSPPVVVGQQQQQPQLWSPTTLSNFSSASSSDAASSTPGLPSSSSSFDRTTYYGMPSSAVTAPSAVDQQQQPQYSNYSTVANTAWSANTAYPSTAAAAPPASGSMITRSLYPNQYNASSVSDLNFPSKSANIITSSVGVEGMPPLFVSSPQIDLIGQSSITTQFYNPLAPPTSSE